MAQGLKDAANEVFVSRGFLANIPLAPAVHFEPGTHAVMGLLEFTFLRVGREAIDMDFARLAYPQYVAVVVVLVRCEQSSQFINGWLIVQIHF